MDNPITPLDRTSLYQGSGRVKPMQESEKEKERKKFLEELEEEIDEEEKKKRKQDSVDIGLTDRLADAEHGTEEQASDDGEQKEPETRHLDLTA